MDSLQNTIPDEQKHDPFTLCYSDLLAALMLVFILLLASTLLRMKDEEEKKEERANRITIIKDEIIAQLRAAFEKEGITIEVNPHTGAITFKEEDIYFVSGSSLLMPKGKARLDQVIPVYLNVLMNPKFKDDITQILVEGHTDPQAFKGPDKKIRYASAYLDNLELSMKRARSVVTYMLSMDLESIGKTETLPNIVNCSDRLKGLLTATGASFSQPLDGNGEIVQDVPYEAIRTGVFKKQTSTIDYERCRRVEITFRLNDEEYLREIREILAED